MKTKFYAFCSGHNWTGTKHDTEKPAEQDAENHIKKYTTHHGKVAVYKEIHNDDGTLREKIKIT